MRQAFAPISLVIALLVALVPAQLVHAADTAFVVAAMNSWRFLIVRSGGDALMVDTIERDQSWGGCALMGKSLGSVITVGNESGTGMARFPGSTLTCPFVRVVSVGNPFRSQGGAIEARYLAGIAEYTKPILVDTSGKISVLTITPGCIPTLAANIGAFIFTGSSFTNFAETKPVVYLFSTGTTCIITDETRYSGSVTLPTSYKDVLSEYEDRSWILTAKGIRIPPPFASTVTNPADTSTGAPSVSSLPKTTTPASRSSSTARFADVPSTHFAFSYVAKLVSAGVIQAGSQFHPDASITRAEYAKLIVLARHQELRKPPWPEWFSDVAASSSLAPYIYTIASRSWATGQDGRFYPDDSISRVEAVVILQRAFALPTDSSVKFSDVSGAGADAASAAQHAHIVSGSNGRFDPARPITRAEAAKIISLAMDHAKK